MVVLDLRCVFGGGERKRERARERERETFPYEMVLEEVSLCIQASVLESHCGKVWKKKKRKKKKSFHFGVKTVAVCGSWTLIYSTTYKLML